jgi:hypothetical protein
LLLKISAADRGNVAMLNTYYFQKELEYIKTGTRLYPVLEELQKLAEGLFGALEPICRRALKEEKYRPDEEKRRPRRQK